MENGLEFTKDDRIDLKALFENGNYMVAFDTNVYLNLYRDSPDWAEYILDCMKRIKNYIIVPQMIFIEFNKHHKSLFVRRKKAIENSVDDAFRLIDSQRTKLINSCNGVLRRGNYPDLDLLVEKIESKYEDIRGEFENYFEEHSILSLIKDSWSDDLPSNFVKALEASGQVMSGFTTSELYELCEEGKLRYEKEIPPGYKDGKNKDGIRKYGDLIWWQEVLQYVKNCHKNIILVTDDIKEDWWRKENNNYRFREELIKEFQIKTKSLLQNQETYFDLKAFMSKEFFEALSESYGIDQPDAIDIAMSLTDSEYIASIQESVFDKVVYCLLYSGSDYIDEDNHIGTEGVDEWELRSSEYKNYEMVERVGDLVTYRITYEVELYGTSYDYWGRDDDTKEIIKSPDIHHLVKGAINVTVKRTVDMMMDFSENTEFDDCEIKTGILKEIEYEVTDEDDCYDICPRCGDPINFDNDAGNGFCISCTRESDNI